MNQQLEPLSPIIKDLQSTPNSVLLIAGGKPGLFDVSLRENARIEFWHSTEHSSRQSSRSIPDRTTAIVINRFLDHSLSNNLRSEATRLGIKMYSKPLGPGTIVDLVKAAGLTGEGPVIVAEPQPRVAHGALKAFLGTYANFTAAEALPEIDRLWKIAEEQGLATTKASISQSFYATRRAMTAAVMATASVITPTVETLPEEPPAPEAPPPPTPPAPPTPAPPSMPVPVTPTPTIVPPKVTQGTTSVAEVVSLIDDALHTLENAATGLHLVKDAIQQIEPRLAESAAIAARLEKIRELAGLGL